MTGDIAHVCNRGVEKRKIFLDRYDHERFIENLFLLNNAPGKIRTKKKYPYNDPSLTQDKLVEVLKWTLLPNHYHLLLYEVVDGGILEFTKRLGNAYTKYFNIKNKGRSGYVFQNHAKQIPIENDPQFVYIPFYVDLNSLDKLFAKWRNEPIPKTEEAIEYMRRYEWSSFADYFGSGVREGVVNQDLFYEIFGTDKDQYLEDLKVFLSDGKVSTCEVDTFTGL